MPTPTKGNRLGGSPAHERAMLNNMASQLFENKSITTTVTKAKRLRPVAERLITFAKRGDLAARRRVMQQIGDKSVVHELFTSIAPAVAERPGGYTRITKIGPRKGDNAPMAVIELVLEAYSPKQATVKEAEETIKAAAADEPKAEDTAGDTAGDDETPEVEPDVTSGAQDDEAQEAAEQSEDAEKADDVEKADDDK